MKNIHNLEVQAQQQDPITMATSESAATIQGIYAAQNNSNTLDYRKKESRSKNHSH